MTARNDAEQKAHDEEAERLKNPHLLDLWSGLLDSGQIRPRRERNSSTLSYTLAAKAVRETPRDKISVYTTAVYATDDSTTPPSRTTAHAIQGGHFARI